MAAFKFLFALLASLQSCCFCLISENKFIKSVAVGKLCDTTPLTHFGTTKTAIRCSLECDKVATCNSFFYNKITQECLGSNTIWTDLTGCSDVTDVVYYTTVIQVWGQCTTDTDCPVQFTSCEMGLCKCATGKIPSIDFRSCTAGTTNHMAMCTGNTDCYGDAMECWDGKCTCQPGYSLQPRDKTCHTSCTTYGTTFSLYKDHTLACTGSDVHVMVTPQDCETICGTGPCRSIRYAHFYTECKTDDCTVLTNPGDFFPIAGVDLYIRNCDPDLS